MGKTPGAGTAIYQYASAGIVVKRLAVEDRQVGAGIAAQKVWHQCDAFYRTAVDLLEQGDQERVEPVSLNLAEIEKVGLIGFELDVVKK
jgi:hypothetical protein